MFQLTYPFNCHLKMKKNKIIKLNKFKMKIKIIILLNMLQKTTQSLKNKKKNKKLLIKNLKKLKNRAKNIKNKMIYLMIASQLYVTVK